MNKEYRFVELKHLNTKLSDKQLFNVVTFIYPQHTYIFKTEIVFDTPCMEINHYFKTYIENNEEKMKIYTDIARYEDEALTSDSLTFEYKNVPLRCKSRYIKDKDGNITYQYLYVNNANVETVYK